MQAQYDTCVERMYLLVSDFTDLKQFSIRSNSNITRLSANMAVATLSTGMVGPSMGLAFWDSFAIIVIINLFSCLVPAFTATFGLTGLRMTTFS